MKRYASLSETVKKRQIRQRMIFVHGVLLTLLLVLVARLLELQVIRGAEYRSAAQSQHYGGVVLPAKRGEILSRNSKTGETSKLATNTTLDMVYVDPLITDDPHFVATILSDLLVTDAFHSLCSQASDQCPVELAPYYSAVFDPLERARSISSGVLLEPLSGDISVASANDVPSVEEVRRSFRRDIEEKISEKRVTFVPLVYGATKVQMNNVDAMGIPGIEIVRSNRLIYADPESVNQSQIGSIAKKLSGPLETENSHLLNLLRSRPLRYVPIMRRLSPELSLKIKEEKLNSFQETNALKREAPDREQALKITDPLRSVALIPEHWRYYPDDTIASHVVGFLNINQDAQYGIERTFDPQLRGQEGLISSLSDPSGGQILTAEQQIINPKDGDTIILTIDRFVQKKVEEILDRAVRGFEADSGQAIVMDPFTGRIIAMANAPLFDSNIYGTVYEKDLLYLDEKKQKEVVVELYNPDTNEFVLKAYYDDVFTEEGRKHLSDATKEKLAALEQLYDLEDIVRYYLYIGENSRREIFPTHRPDFWLKYQNNIGVGAYLNRNVQEIYEPGSVFKPITMAIAIDQGEVTPDDLYDDKKPVKVDEYTIKNALNAYYGEVTMTNCLEYSINTCMTSVSFKLGKKLFNRMIERFGFGRITGIELEDELPGEVLPWKKWSRALLATAAYGQGISATPLQVVTAISALANGGKLMRPTIIDSIIYSDGETAVTKPQVVDQVITPETSDTITAMLVSAVDNGFAKTAKVKGYKIAGKTGTSQIAGPGGKYETGTGSSITSFAGYAPVSHPKFVMLIKFDRPRAKDIEYGSQSAAPVFKEIATFLFDYYGIPPDAE